MRVLHVQKVSGVGGSERHLEALVRELPRRGVETRMAVLAAGDAERFLARLRAQGTDAVRIPAGPDVNPALIARLWREIRRYRPHLVHTHLIHADVHGQPAARAAGVPAISSAHGAHPFFTREPYRSAARAAGRMARCTIAISEHVARMLRDQRIVPAQRLRVVHYGLDAEGWSGGDADRAAARQRYGLEDDEIAVGVASRLVAHKGHDVLIEAFAKAIDHEPRLRLLVAGSGPLRDELEGSAKRALPQGTARFVGHVDHVPTFMQACDVMTFPTLPEFGEGFGLAALEAMAAGRPLVASRVASLPEVVGDVGILVQAGSVPELADTLVRLASDAQLRISLGSRARHRALTEFSLERMVDRTMDVYAEVLTRPRARASAG
jgi:glycosyltransferase involved in cell wall biosynthesis